MSRLRRGPDEGRAAQERLAALFGAVRPLPPNRLSPDRLPPDSLPPDLPTGWVLPPEEDPVPPPPLPGVPELPEPPAPPTGGRGLLPSPLRGGRWDPGRRGALALAVVAALGAVLAGVVVLRSRPVEVAAPAVTRAAPSASPSPAPGAVVVVAVAGKVTRPGLVRLPVGARVDDAVRAAGGVLPGADPGLLNLARLLVDGEQLLVGIPAPPGSELVPGGGSSAPSAAGGKVDLNSASVTDLDVLPGIGPVLARAIVDWRTEHRRVASVDQLREVPGIGEAKYASLRDKVRV